MRSFAYLGSADSSGLALVTKQLPGPASFPTATFFGVAVKGRKPGGNRFGEKGDLIARPFAFQYNLLETPDKSSCVGFRASIRFCRRSLERASYPSDLLLEHRTLPARAFHLTRRLRGLVEVDGLGMSLQYCPPAIPNDAAPPSAAIYHNGLAIPPRRSTRLVASIKILQNGTRECGEHSRRPLRAACARFHLQGDLLKQSITLWIRECG
jgi:hypothetical protein